LEYNPENKKKNCNSQKGNPVYFGNFQDNQIKILGEKPSKKSANNPKNQKRRNNQ